MRPPKLFISHTGGESPNPLLLPEFLNHNHGFNHNYDRPLTHSDSEHSHSHSNSNSDSDFSEPQRFLLQTAIHPILLPTTLPTIHPANMASQAPTSASERATMASERAFALWKVISNMSPTWSGIHRGLDPECGVYRIPAHFAPRHFLATDEITDILTTFSTTYPTRSHLTAETANLLRIRDTLSSARANLYRISLSRGGDPTTVLNSPAAAAAAGAATTTTSASSSSTTSAFNASSFVMLIEAFNFESSNSEASSSESSTEKHAALVSVAALEVKNLLVAVEKCLVAYMAALKKLEGLFQQDGFIGDDERSRDRRDWAVGRFKYDQRMALEDLVELGDGKENDKSKKVERGAFEILYDRIGLPFHKIATNSRLELVEQLCNILDLGIVFFYAKGVVGEAKSATVAVRRREREVVKGIQQRFEKYPLRLATMVLDMQPPKMGLGVRVWVFRCGGFVDDDEDEDDEEGGLRLRIDGSEREVRKLFGRLGAGLTGAAVVRLRVEREDEDEGEGEGKGADVMDGEGQDEDELDSSPGEMIEDDGETEEDDEIMAEI